MNKPADHPHVVPYLIVADGNGFMHFLEGAFGATHPAVHRHDDGRLMHAEARVGTGVIMYGESSDQWPPQPGSLFLYVDDADVTYKRAIDNGATPVMELSNQSYGRTGGVKDPFGNTWWITTP